MALAYSRKVIGRALVKWNNKDVVRDVVIIDKSRLEELGCIRVVWRDEQDRRVTSFIEEENLLEEYDKIN